MRRFRSAKRGTKILLPIKFKALRIFSLFTVILGAATSPTTSEVVRYGSGTTHVERNIGKCTIDPGAICGGLATACAASATDKDAGFWWTIAVCAAAGLWCGGQALLDILCCFEKIPSCKKDGGGFQYTGPKEVDVNAREVQEIASFHDPGADFSGQGLLHFIQGSAETNDSDIIGHKDRMDEIDRIMTKLTGNKNGFANAGQVNAYLRGSNTEAGFNL